MSKEYTITRLINSRNYICYNKDVAKIFGPNVAIVFAELVNLCDYFGGKEFYFEQEKLCNDTALSKYQLREAMKILVENGIVTVTRRGIPSKNYYLLHIKAMVQILDSHDTDLKPETSQDDGEGADQQANSPEKETVKRVPLVNRVPKNDIEEVEKEYLLNYNKLYEQGSVRNPKPVLNWKASRRLTKNAIMQYGKENIVMAVKKSIQNDFCVKKGYSLTTILSGGVLAELINGNSDPPKHIDLSDRYDMTQAKGAYYG